MNIKENLMLPSHEQPCTQLLYYGISSQPSAPTSPFHLFKYEMCHVYTLQVKVRVRAVVVGCTAGMTRRVPPETGSSASTLRTGDTTIDKNTTITILTASTITEVVVFVLSIQRILLPMKLFQPG